MDNHRVSERIGNRICTLVLPSRESNDSENKETEHSFISTFAPCDPLICFEKYVLACSSTGLVCLYSILSFSDSQQQENLHIANVRTTVSLAQPTVGVQSDIEDFDLATYQNEINKQTRRRAEAQDSVLPVCIVNLNRTQMMNSNLSSRESSSKTVPMDSSITIIDGCTYTLQKLQDDPQNPVALHSHSFLGYVILLSSEGTVFMLELSEHSSLQNHSIQVLLTMKTSFHVGCCGATSICVTDLPFYKNHVEESNQESEGSNIAIYTAHDSGVIVAHGFCLNSLEKISSTPNVYPSKDTPNTLRRHNNSINSRLRPKLLWKGSFYNPVYSLSSFNHHQNANSKSNSFPFLLAGLRAWKSFSNGSANDAGNSFEDEHRQTIENGSIEVLNTYALQAAWNENGSRKSSLLSLDEFCSWPGAGMEIADPNIDYVWDQIQRVPTQSKVKRNKTSAKKSKQLEKGSRKIVGNFDINGGNYIRNEIIQMRKCSPLNQGLEMKLEASAIHSYELNRLLVCAHPEHLTHCFCTHCSLNSGASCISSLDPVVTITMSSGLISFLHCTSSKLPVQSDDTNNHSFFLGEATSQWGVANPLNQFILPHPCIGIGYLQQDDMDKSPMANSHVACCLRGGTVYILPFISPTKRIASGSKALDGLSSITDHTITIYHCPVALDGNDDGIARCVHGFTAGNVEIKYWNDESRNMYTGSNLNESNDIIHSANFISENEEKSRNYVPQRMTNCSKLKYPVLVYSWGAGIMDVYSCVGFNRNNDCIHANNTGLLLQKMLKNDSIKILVTHLLQTDRSKLPKTTVWQHAWEESRSGSYSTTFIIEGLMTGNKFHHIRTLLLNIARGESRFI